MRTGAWRTPSDPRRRLHRHPELEIHLKFALRQGWTETELVEVMLQLTGYVGVPLVREAMQVATKVFDEAKGAGPA